MFEISEISLSGLRRVLDTAESFEAAKAKVEAMGVSYMEDDSQYEGCADAFLYDGRVVAIQPEGFKTIAERLDA